MRSCLANILAIDSSDINIKAKTENLGFLQVEKKVKSLCHSSFKELGAL